MAARLWVLALHVQIASVRCAGPSHLSGLPQCPSCDINAVVNANAHIATLTEADFNCFINTLDPSCKSNVEYSEFSNEVLFKIVARHPMYLVRYVQEDAQPERTAYVLSQLSAPSSDDITPEECARVISSLKDSSAAQNRILQALKP